MKPLAIWLSAFVVLTGAISFGYHLLRQGSPERVFVVVDSSFDMLGDWSRIPALLDELDDERYAEFALATEKDGIGGHGWQDTLDLRGVEPFAPRDLSCLESTTCYAELADATERILVTNAAESDLARLTDWKVVRP